MLPWTTEDGKQCLLSTGDEGGLLSWLADDFEAVQLGMGADVLSATRKVLDNPLSPYAEVRYAALRLSECLTDALRIAESRGLRLSAPDIEEDDSDSENDPESPA
ncbi:hypothetical protein [Streptomyces sp. ISL-100]|uniref:hypothetical protein n=1 Tax=Streptomyces sp. ISL-100 TaxID=2819173 RepID=UPI0027E59184|nr:hypothetical protein [Streptomyces sp. ISL-100]